MKKTYKEAIHYLILAVLLTGIVFLAYFTSQIIGLVSFLVSSTGILKIIAWCGLFVWYLLIIGITLTIIDLILHKTLKI